MHNDKNSRFIKDQEAKEFLSQLGTKTPLDLHINAVFFFNSGKQIKLASGDQYVNGKKNETTNVNPGLINTWLIN